MRREDAKDGRHECATYHPEQGKVGHLLKGGELRILPLVDFV